MAGSLGSVSWYPAGLPGMRFWIASFLVLAGCSRSSVPLRVGLPDSLEADPLRVYLSRTLARPIEIRLYPQYAPLIAALQSQQLDVAYLSAAAYARAWKESGGKVEPVVAALDEEGKPVCFSMIIVKNESPIHTVADLKNRTLATPDRDSMEGFVGALRDLRLEGYARAFFGDVVVAGSPRKAVKAVLDGEHDAAITWWYGESRNALAAMERKGGVPAGALRTIWVSQHMPSPVWAIPKQGATVSAGSLRRALIQFREKDPGTFEAFADGGPTGYAETSHEAYAPVLQFISVPAKKR